MDSAVEMETYGLDVAVPDSVAGRERAEDGIRVLVKAAMPHYNRAVRSARSGEVEEALQAIRSALRLFPYSRKFVDLGLTLSIQHGDFGLAKRLLRLADKLGIDEDLPEYRNALGEAISDWNRFLEDTAALRDKYQDEAASQSYRELLLLASRVPNQTDPSGSEPLSEQERFHLQDLGISRDDPDPSRSTGVSSAEKWLFGAGKRAAVLGIVGALGLAVGFAANSITGNQGRGIDPAVGAAGSDTTTSPPPVRVDSILRQIATINRNLAEGKPLAAANAYDKLSVPKKMSNQSSTAKKVKVASESLQPAIDWALYEKAVGEWEQENFDRAVDLLTEIDSNEVGTEREKFYMLGISAHKTSRPELAKENLQKLLEGPFSLEDYPHYEAQAAYVLVQLLSGDESQKYARLIAEKYSDTIYYNSTVRSLI